MEKKKVVCKALRVLGVKNMVEMVRCGGGKEAITQGRLTVVPGPSRSKNKGHLSSHLPPMARSRATLGMPSIQVSLLMAIKIQSKISYIAGKPSPLLWTLV